MRLGNIFFFYTNLKGVLRSTLGTPHAYLLFDSYKFISILI